MRRLREGLGETPQHADYLDDLRSRHKAKRNFMKLMATTGNHTGDEQTGRGYPSCAFTSAISSSP